MVESSIPSNCSNAAICGKRVAGHVATVFRARDYDLAATLASGQAFRWRHRDGAWIGVVGPHLVRLRQAGSTITAATASPVANWTWLEHYLQIEVDLEPVLASFPADAPLRAAVNACRGLRLLRQDPWECLASFILSSTKQIVQIRRIIARLCECFGERLPDFEMQDGNLESQSALVNSRSEPVVQIENPMPIGNTCIGDSAFMFPSPRRLAGATEADLRACKMGFRAPYLLAAARIVAGGGLDLKRLGQKPLEAARGELMQLAGVGRKIADCVLLFAYGFQGAFPMDVWVLRALQRLYFADRPATLKSLRLFSETHFGPNAGYAQQYLFHYMRTVAPHGGSSRLETTPGKRRAAAAPAD